MRWGVFHGNDNALACSTVISVMMLADASARYVVIHFMQQAACKKPIARTAEAVEHTPGCMTHCTTNIAPGSAESCTKTSLSVSLYVQVSAQLSGWRTASGMLLREPATASIDYTPALAKCVMP